MAVVFVCRISGFHFIPPYLSRDCGELEEFKCMNDSVPCARLFLLEPDTLCRCEQHVQPFCRNYLVCHGPSEICYNYTIFLAVSSVFRNVSNAQERFAKISSASTRSRSTLVASMLDTRPDDVAILQHMMCVQYCSIVLILGAICFHTFPRCVLHCFAWCCLLYAGNVLCANVGCLPCLCSLLMESADG